LNAERVNVASGFRSRAGDFEEIAGEFPEDALGEVRTAGVSCAEDQDKWFVHGSTAFGFVSSRGELVHAEQKLSKAVAGEGVKDLEAALLTVEHSRPAHQAEVFGDGGDVGADEVLEVANTHLTVPERLGDQEAGRMRERLDHGGAFLERAPPGSGHLFGYLAK